jgi:hypothetical protein
MNCPAPDLCYKKCQGSCLEGLRQQQAREISIRHKLYHDQSLIYLSRRALGDSHEEALQAAHEHQPQPTEENQ